jgi:hypothetical protein
MTFLGEVFIHSVKPVNKFGSITASTINEFINIFEDFLEIDSILDTFQVSGNRGDVDISFTCEILGVMVEIVSLLAML